MICWILLLFQEFEKFFEEFSEFCIFQKIGEIEEIKYTMSNIQVCGLLTDLTECLAYLKRNWTQIDDFCSLKYQESTSEID